jgi:hypothetical protein
VFLFLAYARYRWADWNNRLRTNPSVVVESSIKGIVLAALIAFAALVSSLSAWHEFLHTGGLDLFAPHRWLLAVGGVGAICAQLSIDLVTPLPVEPFRRFSGIRRWVVRSLLYPVPLSPTLWALGISGFLLYGAKTVVLTGGVYLAFVASRFWLARILLIISSITASRIAWTDTGAVCLVGGVVLCAILVILVRVPRGRREAETVSFSLQSLSSFRKELASLKLYQSERVFMLIGLAGSVALPLLVLNGSGGKVPESIMWVLPWFGLTPFLRTLYNVLGTESPAIRALIRRPAFAIEFMRRRLRFYSIAAYVVEGLIGGVMLWYFGLHMWSRIALTLIAYTEWILVVGLLFSLVGYEPKPLLYSPINSFSSANTMASLISSILIALVVARAFQAFGLLGISLVAGGALATQALWLSALGERVLRSRVERLRLA